MSKNKKYFSLGLKMYIFVAVTVIVVAFGTTCIAYWISSNQIDRYYKHIAQDNAKNFATLVDADYLAGLRKTAESDEFRQLREKAEAADDEKLIADYLDSKGLLDKFYETREAIITYVENIRDIKYLYTIVDGGRDAESDMYLIDDGDAPLLNLGYYEEREPEFMGKGLTDHADPLISHGEWGWLCSAYAPVIDSGGNMVCVVGCDYDMEEVMGERFRFFGYILAATIGFTAVVLAAAVYFVTRTVVKPLKTINLKTKVFKPEKDINYADSGVIDLKLDSSDEISDIYESIRSMQIDIIDYLNVLHAAETDIKEKNAQIGEISRKAYQDALTGVGSKAAYFKKIEELDGAIGSGLSELAMVMVDIDDVKTINDNYGHKTGDMYIAGCCHVICDIFKHSPVFRIGGAEFIAILQGEDYEARRELVRKLKEKLAYKTERTDKTPWQRYSAYVGMGEASAEDNTIDLIFKRADEDMYEDKKRSENRINA